MAEILITILEFCLPDPKQNVLDPHLFINEGILPTCILSVKTDLKLFTYVYIR